MNVLSETNSLLKGIPKKTTQGFRSRSVVTRIRKGPVMREADPYHDVITRLHPILSNDAYMSQIIGSNTINNAL